MKTAAIINPQSGQGRAMARWDCLQAELRALYGPMKVCFTTHPGHGTELTRALLQEGYRHLITAGGDGTHFEVINGCFLGGKILRPDIRLTVLPFGTGSDLARSLGIQPGLKGLIRLKNAHIIQADVGRITCAREPGSSERGTYYFLNMGRIGMGGAVSQYVNENSKSIGGFFSYLRGVLVTLRTYRDKNISLTIDGHITLDGPTKDIALANGTYDGGGMKMAPHARLDSGVLDLYHIGPIGFLDAVRSLPKLYRGRLSERPDVVRYFRGRHIEVYSDDTVDVEVEGEFIGYLPATIDLLPGIVQLTDLRHSS